MSLDTAKAITGLRGLTGKFDIGIRNARTMYERVAMTVPSTGADEQYSFLGDVPGIVEWLGERQFKELRAAHWTLANKLWE